MSKNNKYGFVYIWFDRKHKRYYIGCHWGNENDGYICSSNWMRDAYRRRPDDFKRRVIRRVYTSRQDTFDEEQRYLDMIKDKEIKTRYYNLNTKVVGNWSTDEKNRKTIGQKLSETLKGNTNNVGHFHSDKTKLKISKSLKGRIYGPMSDETKKKISESKKGKPHSDETKKKIGKGNKGKIFGPMSDETKIKLSEIKKGKNAGENNSMYGKTHTDESKEKMREAAKNRKTHYKLQ